MADPRPVHEALADRFPALAADLAAPRARRVTCLAPPEALHEVLAHAVDALGFDRLCAITGFDEKTHLAASYALSRPDGTVLSVRTRVARERPVLATVTGRFPCAANYERELVDLLGFEVQGLAEGRRYPLPDDWPLDSKPLRKDWVAPAKAPGGLAPAKAPVAAAPEGKGP